ncbi:MAG: hypothetical protein HY840_14510 [Bacteroidetes bacterium]|nr:hypothetical protein [Bacteroidota bacterium]
MKQLLYTMIFIVTGFAQAKSQDLIVTAKGDSLNCRISKIHKSNVYFSRITNREIKDSVLPVSQITYYQINYFIGGNCSSSREIKKTEGLPSFGIGINGGMGNLTGKIPDGLSPQEVSYMKKLRRVYCFAADVNFYTYKSSGFGIKYSMMRTKKSIDNELAVNTSTGQIATGLMQDDITIQFIGPSLFECVRLGKSQSFLLSSRLAIGYVAFKNDVILIEDYKRESNTIGGSWDLGFDYLLTKNVAVGINFSTTIARTRDYRVDGTAVNNMNIEFESRENLSRLDIAIGIKGYL